MDDVLIRNFVLVNKSVETHNDTSEHLWIAYVKNWIKIPTLLTLYLLDLLNDFGVGVTLHPESEVIVWQNGVSDVRPGVRW